MSTTITVRSYREDDFAALVDIQRASFPPPFPSELWWKREQIRSHLTVFPQGALCAEIDGELVGSATAHIIRWQPDHGARTWSEVSDDGYLRNHDPAGDTLYGVDIAVRPDFRRQGVARVLYQARYDLVCDLGLARFMAGSRLAGYHLQRARLTPEAYADAVCQGTLTDPVITPQLRAGLLPLRVVHGYLPDEDAGDCALLMEWRNPQRRQRP
jgi:ribosomal protein S18 acetylase RimI-like enzyme